MKYMEDCLETPLRQILPRMQERIVNQTTYFGVRTMKNPLDYWVYQEIIFETKPDVIVEIGNAFGGSTLALAHLCNSLRHGRVIGLDVSHAEVPSVVRAHSRITLVEGDACGSFDRVASLCTPQDRVLVIEDSSHTYENTLSVLRTYSPMVKPGGYIVVEDGICHHGLEIGPSPGPYEAIETFIRENEDFSIDRSRESFFVTWNPKGYLKRVR